MASTPKGTGYWLLAADGGIFGFGDAAYHGSPTGTGLCELPRAVGMAATATGKGYWVLAADGSVSPFGDATDHSSPKAQGLVLTSAPVDLVTLSR
jgi:hypothetical protein